MPSFGIVAIPFRNFVAYPHLHRYLGFNQVYKNKNSESLKNGRYPYLWMNCVLIGISHLCNNHICNVAHICLALQICTWSLWSVNRKWNFSFSCLLIQRELSRGTVLHFDLKETTFAFGHFTTIYGHFFANYIDIFHKTEIQTVILRCLVCKNLNWIKSYNNIA